MSDMICNRCGCIMNTTVKTCPDCEAGLAWAAKMARAQIGTVHFTHEPIPPEPEKPLPCDYQRGYEDALEAAAKVAEEFAKQERGVYGTNVVCGYVAKNVRALKPGEGK